MKHILSFGGGLNSTAMLVCLYENKQQIDEVIFADTLDEFPDTYKAIDYYENYCKKRNIPFTRLRKDISLYEYCFEKKIIPSRQKRDCTSKFKISPIRNYIRQKYGKKETFVMYIGIDYGELHRMRDSNVKYIKNQYPLVDLKIDRNMCIHLLSERELLIPRKSGCFYCPFTKKSGWVEIIQKNPELTEKAIILEENGKKFPTFLLSSISLKKIRDAKLSERTLKDFEHSCDVSGSCFL